MPAQSLAAARGVDGGPRCVVCTTGSQSRCTRDAKTDVVVRVVGRVVVAVRGAHVVRVVVPGAAAEHAVRR